MRTLTAVIVLGVAALADANPRAYWSVTTLSHDEWRTAQLVGRPEVITHLVSDSLGNETTVTKYPRRYRHVRRGAFDRYSAWIAPRANGPEKVTLKIADGVCTSLRVRQDGIWLDLTAEVTGTVRQ